MLTRLYLHEFVVVVVYCHYLRQIGHLLALLVNGDNTASASGTRSRLHPKPPTTKVPHATKPPFRINYFYFAVNVVTQNMDQQTGIGD